MLNYILIISDITGKISQSSIQDGAITYFLNMAIKGGWLMIPIVLLSFIGVYIFFERYFAIKTVRKEDNTYMISKIKEQVNLGNIKDAIKIAKSDGSSTGHMIEKGLTRIGHPEMEIKDAIETIGNIEISKLEKGLPLLASIAGGAPMIGFLGTVCGMIQAFYDMAMAGSNVDITLLSSGIYQAMVTTVAGLIVGIIAYFAYNILVTDVEKVVHQTENTISDFMDLLNEAEK